MMMVRHLPQCPFWISDLWRCFFSGTSRPQSYSSHITTRGEVEAEYFLYSDTYGQHKWEDESTQTALCYTMHC